MARKVAWLASIAPLKADADDWWVGGIYENWRSFSPEADAVLETQVPGHVDDLGVKGERDAEASQQDVPHREVHQQVVPRVPASAGAQ